MRVCFFPGIVFVLFLSPLSGNFIYGGGGVRGESVWGGGEGWWSGGGVGGGGGGLGSRHNGSLDLCKQEADASVYLMHQALRPTAPFKTHDMSSGHAITTVMQTPISLWHPQLTKKPLDSPQVLMNKHFFFNASKHPSPGSEVAYNETHYVHYELAGVYQNAAAMQLSKVQKHQKHPAAEFQHLWQSQNIAWCRFDNHCATIIAAAHTPSSWQHSTIHCQVRLHVRTYCTYSKHPSCYIKLQLQSCYCYLRTSSGGSAKQQLEQNMFDLTPGSLTKSWPCVSRHMFKGSVRGVL